MLEVMRGLAATSFAAWCSTIAFGQPLCSERVVGLTALEGEIVFHGNETDADCQWYIFPDKKLSGIEFNTSTAVFASGDSLTFYTTLDSVLTSQYVGRFDAYRQIPWVRARRRSALPCVPSRGS